MINPIELGKAGETVRLHTLESVWIQGKLRMWGRWSGVERYGRSGNMFNQLLANTAITKSAVMEALKHLKNSGCSEQELETYLADILQSKQKSNLAFCTDEEAAKIDRVVGAVLIDYPGLHEAIQSRYLGRGKSKKEMARELAEKRPEWCLRTCESRVDVWLSLAESMLYAPMCDEFGTNSSRFRLQSCAESA
ncbi:TPA: DUF1133 family protein [Escherichia coli]|nr:DUF1133 family protein [Escherichia coli]ELG8438864.1 DUF1133 family protein [Escherichia coli]ELO5586672.1 DUF1133 family protein [Escherichia coli]MDI0849794.1 DUF1133 family protein [Escherichia coli]HEI3387804.1 DUF1133 family protein [Escherichia coli]